MCTPSPNCQNCFTYSSNLFKETFFSLATIQDRIDHFMTAKHDFYREPEPEQYLNWFYRDVETIEQAHGVAQAFMIRLGDTIICRETSLCMNRLISIMDYMENYCEWNEEPGYRLLRTAFKAFKFQHSNEENCQVLYRMYCHEYKGVIKFIPKPTKRRGRETEMFDRVSRLKL